MFQKILIANRGEIAVRIIRACREMGIRSVAIYSQADQECLHTMLADEAICIGPGPSGVSYLDMERILSAAVVSGAQAIHPGFGFLSENARFASLCEACGITFIGPSAAVMAKMGDKAAAKEAMIQAGVPVIPGSKGLRDGQKALDEAREMGFPVMIKAAAGGGGRGMRVSHNEKDFLDHFLQAQQETIKGFSDDCMYLEKWIEAPHHIEFQILADQHGNVIHLGERDCSIQRRHQKVLEESPSSFLDDHLRKQMGETAVQAAKAVGYENAGTIEFLVDQDRQFYFMEMNTRIQVEHPVTEAVTGMDLIKAQIRIAAGEKLELTQDEVVLRGYAIECRINAENPAEKFRPCPGKITDLHLPGGHGIRVDTHIYPFYEVPPYYDSLLLKIISHGESREEALSKMRSALGEMVIEGPATNVDFAYEIMNHEAYIRGDTDTSFIDRYFPEYIKG